MTHFNKNSLELHLLGYGGASIITFLFVWFVCWIFLTPRSITIPKLTHVVQGYTRTFGECSNILDKRLVLVCDKDDHCIQLRSDDTLNHPKICDLLSGVPVLMHEEYPTPDHPYGVVTSIDYDKEQ